ncbi:MAG TPA: MotA/TolQ/ExbB proton channel family protein, partial [Candidatus Hydrogenedentes bacterium]|nr:MotA/TolQ/ExbB proton channel family protein [Candidatus Hydrogenedentota bacterium]
MPMDPIAIMEQGGILMWPIFVCSLIALAIVLEKFVSLRRADIDTREFMDTMRQVLRQNRTQEAVEICDETDAPVARIMKAGILKHNRPKEDIREAIEDAGRFEIPRLERYLSGLATCATVAPMLGLFGTVGGMMVSFDRIAAAGQPRISDLAGGIRFALVTTYEGLLVAIPTTILYAVFRNRVARIAGDVALLAEDLID